MTGRAHRLLGTIGCAAIVLPVLLAAPVSATSTVTYHFLQETLGGPASAGSLRPAQQVTFPVYVYSGGSRDPGGTVYLSQQQKVAGDATTVSGAQCGGVTRLSATPTLCTADTSGAVQLTYIVPAQPPGQGNIEWLAGSTASSTPPVFAHEYYVYCTVYRFTSSPIAPGGSLSPGEGVPVTLTAEDGVNSAVPNSPVYLSFKPTSGGGRASVGSTLLTSTPAVFLTNSNGAIQIAYTAPTSLPAVGQDEIVAQDSTGGVSSSGADYYAYSAAVPVVAVGDVSAIEADQSPRIPFHFTVTLSPVQTQSTTVEYSTLCGVGDRACGPGDDINTVTTPITVTVPAGANHVDIVVQAYSYIGAHAGETYNEGFFISLSNPGGAVLGRSKGEGIILPDVEHLQSTVADLYLGTAGLVPVNSTETMHFTVTLGALQTTTVTFSYATADGTATDGTAAKAGVDYVAASGTLSIAPNQDSAIISIPLLANPPPGANKTFTVTISHSSGPPIAITPGSPPNTPPGTATGTVLAN